MKLSICLVAVCFGIQALAMGAKPPPKPTPLPTDEPTAALPGVCQIAQSVQLNAGRRTMTYSNLDHRACVYRSTSYSSSDNDMARACSQVVVNAGYSGNGYLRCDKSWSPPNVTVGCSNWPEEQSIVQVFTATYNLDPKEYSVLQCRQIDLCIQNILTDPRANMLARQWQHKLGCVSGE